MDASGYNFQQQIYIGVHVMYLLSSRKNFTDPYIFSTLPQIGRLYSNGRISKVSADVFANRIKGKKVLVLLHGFSKTFEVAVEEYLESYKRIRNYIGDEYDEIVGYIWPLGESKQDHFEIHMLRNTRYAGELLRNWFIHFLGNQTTVDIMGHSIGLGVGYIALQGTLPFRVRNVFSMGPAIPVHWLLKDQTQNAMLNNARRFYLFYTRNDMILKYGFQVAMGVKALGYSGPPNPDQFLNKFNRVSVVDCSEVIMDHFGYLKTPAVFHLIRDLLRDTKAERNIKLKEYVAKGMHLKAQRKYHQQTTFEFETAT